MQRSENNLDSLEQTLVNTGLDQASAQAPVPAYVYLVTKIFPLLATGVFASTTDVEKPESIALSAAMVSSTALPVISDLLKLSGRLPQLMETMAGVCLFAGVGMMDQGAIKEDNQSVRSFVSLTAVGCFSLFAAINLVYNALKLAGCVKGKKPGVELASSSFGLVGSLLFLVGNTLGFLAQQDANKSIDVPARMIAVASCFTLSTALHAVLAGRAVCAKKPEDDALSEVIVARGRSVSDLTAGDDVKRLVSEGRVTVVTEDQNSLLPPSAAPASPRRASPRIESQFTNPVPMSDQFDSSSSDQGCSPRI